MEFKIIVFLYIATLLLSGLALLQQFKIRDMEDRVRNLQSKLKISTKMLSQNMATDFDELAKRIKGEQ